MIRLLDIAHHTFTLGAKGRRYCRFKGERIEQEIKARKKEALKNVFDGIVRKRTQILY